MLDIEIQQHLVRRARREVDLEAARRRQLFITETFRQSAMQSVAAHQLRLGERRFLALAKDVEEIVLELRSLTLFLVWIWDVAKNRERFLSVMDKIETALHASGGTKEEIASLLSLFENAKRDPMMFFRNALDNLVVLSRSEDILCNPVLALRQIHETQDHLFVTSAMLRSLLSVASEEHLIDSEKQGVISDALSHIVRLHHSLEVQQKHCYFD